jgi:hypothetical protein
VKKTGALLCKALKSDEIKFDLVGACIARPPKSAENKSGRPMVAPTNKTEVL